MNCYNTGRVQIGRCYTPKPMPIASLDAIKLQSALLDKRTRQPLTFVQKVFGFFWRLA